MSAPRSPTSSLSRPSPAPLHPPLPPLWCPGAVDAAQPTADRHDALFGGAWRQARRAPLQERQVEGARATAVDAHAALEARCVAVRGGAYACARRRVRPGELHRDRAQQHCVHPVHRARAGQRVGGVHAHKQTHCTHSLGARGCGIAAGAITRTERWCEAKRVRAGGDAAQCDQQHPRASPPAGAWHRAVSRGPRPPVLCTVL